MARCDVAALLGTFRQNVHETAAIDVPDKPNEPVAVSDYLRRSQRRC